ncbi:hypothetical protein [Salipiger mangrovisoli]|uniref:Uncharacterized protein n=1 Tax=Salipiger mangrovisoli TaxID=2865933 RepID=A0ABR9XAM5_9RHOB|nr:hypothetical protein [Salipiger mangrovisoli]MBE9640660.1 hypothetical protein [Salipiger mangrovisoli]
MRQRRFGKTIKDLLLALLNATLILVALCLFLGLQLSSRVQDITDSFARNLVSIDPLRDEIGTVTAEVSGLRSDLQALRAGGTEMTTEAAQRITARLDLLDSRLGTAAERIEGLLNSPEQLVDHAVESAAAEIRKSLGALRGCVPSDTVSLSHPALPLPPQGDTT